jgi:hypothetical protein
MKTVIRYLFAIGSLCAVVDIFTSPQLHSFGVARFSCEAILVTLAATLGWRQIYASWRENRRWFSKQARFDMRLLWRNYGVLNEKIGAFEGSAAESKLRQKAPDLFSPDGTTVRLAVSDEIKLVTDAHFDLTATDDRIVQDFLRRNLAKHAIPLPPSETFSRQLEAARDEQIGLQVEHELQLEALQSLDPEAAALRELRELMLRQTNTRLRELRILENVRSRGQAVEPCAGDSVDLETQIANERAEMEQLIALQTQLKESLQPTAAQSV